MIRTTNLLGLAPVDLPVARTLRYDGGGFGLPMAMFLPEDQVIIAQVYQAVKGVYDCWQAMRGAPDPEVLRRKIQELGSDTFVAAAQRLGEATCLRPETPPMLRKVVHDVRGGGLTVLVGTASFLALGLPGVADGMMQTCVHLARDHAKIMRNALVDIDVATRAADEAARAHDIDHFTEKWDGATVQVGGKAVRIDLDCTFRGSISARCLETSAIDRVLYNYVNNAARFTADGRVTLTVFPVGSHLVRWVVANVLTAGQIDWLEHRTGPDLLKLFEGGLTRGGNGLGLSNCADIVAACFGLEDSRQAVERGYLGAKVLDGSYHAWFHWPAVITAGAGA